MRKKHKKHEEHMDETWLIPYADMLTLLLALFLVLYAMSSVDEYKFQELKKALQSLFSGGVGVMVSDKGLTEMDDNPFTDTPPPNYVTEERTLRQYQERMNQYFKEEGIQAQVTSTITKQGLLVTIQDVALFDSGKADIRPEARVLLLYLGFLFEEFDNEVQIGGHTDNLPIHTAQFPSNWELSAQRAVNVATYIINNTSCEPSRFSAAGHSEYKPIDTNATAAGRAKNRRVEMLILRKYALPEAVL